MNDSGSLFEAVLAAVTTEVVTAAGEPMTTVVRRSLVRGQAVVDYLKDDVPLFSRGFQVHERDRTVSLGRCVLTGHEREGYANAVAVHERFLARLARLVEAPCTLRTEIRNVEGPVWVPYFDWARGMATLNAQALAFAVSYLRVQARWDTTGIPEAVELVAGPDPHLDGTERQGEGSCAHVIEHTTPATLFSLLDDIRQGLGREVFEHMRPWHGQHVVAGASPGADAGRR